MQISTVQHIEQSEVEWLEITLFFFFFIFFKKRGVFWETLTTAIYISIILQTFVVLPRFFFACVKLAPAPAGCYDWISINAWRRFVWFSLATAPESKSACTRCFGQLKGKCLQVNVIHLKNSQRSLILLIITFSYLILISFTWLLFSHVNPPPLHCIWILFISYVSFICRFDFFPHMVHFHILFTWCHRFAWVHIRVFSA